MTYLYLALAIVAEVLATTFLKLSDGFSKPLPSAVTVVGYAVAFYFLSLTLRNLPTGLVYAVWSGVGVVLIATIAWVFQSQKSRCGRAVRHGIDRVGGGRDQPVFQRVVALRVAPAFRLRSSSCGGQVAGATNIYHQNELRTLSKSLIYNSDSARCRHNI